MQERTDFRHGIKEADENEKRQRMGYKADVILPLWAWGQRGLKRLKVTRPKVSFTRGKLGYGRVWRENSPAVGSLACLGINETCRKTHPLFDKNYRFDHVDKSSSWTHDLAISSSLFCKTHTKNS